MGLAAGTGPCWGVIAAAAAGPVGNGRSLGPGSSSSSSPSEATPPVNSSFSLSFNSILVGHPRSDSCPGCLGALPGCLGASSALRHGCPTSEVVSIPRQAAVGRMVLYACLDSPVRSIVISPAFSSSRKRRPTWRAERSVSPASVSLLAKQPRSEAPYQACFKIASSKTLADDVSLDARIRF
jgi:hypothetical protein